MSKEIGNARVPANRDTFWERTRSERVGIEEARRAVLPGSASGLSPSGIGLLRSTGSQDAFRCLRDRCLE